MKHQKAAKAEVELHKTENKEKHAMAVVFTTP